MSNDKAKKAMQELVRETERLREAFKNSVNALGRPEELIEAISRWQEKRKCINALGIGLIIGIKQFEFVNFPLTGDPAQDLGQVRPENEVADPKNPTAKEGGPPCPDAGQANFDEAFLRGLNIKKLE